MHKSLFLVELSQTQLTDFTVFLVELSQTQLTDFLASHPEMLDQFVIENIDLGI